MTGTIEGSGNIMSLLDSTMQRTDVPDNAFCYMFFNCTSLISAPELPATELAYKCYNNMFWSCTSLISAPELPATELVDSCYNSMFENCTSLISAPELPATELAERCYITMFSSCSSLTSLTVKADDISATDCITNWLKDITTNGTLHSLGSADFTSKIPSTWTIVHE